MKHINILLILAILFLSGCSSKTKHHTAVITKCSETDRFKKSLVESQYFTIRPSGDNVVESKNGNLFIIPANAFLDADGEPVKDSVQLELAEASEVSEMITSNLVMQDPKALTETHEAFFVNATQKGKQLYINKQNPLYVELSADKALNLFKGARNKTGNMNWDSILNPVKYLLPVPMELLSFYPKGFEEKVEERLPYKHHTILTKDLLDSLYYSFAVQHSQPRNHKWSGAQMVNLVSPLVKLFPPKKTKLQDIEKDSSVLELSSCGINPSSIKAIRDQKFQNTLISTREFELRLQIIFKTCDNRILELYVNNLNKNLWEIDQMAAELLGKQQQYYTNFIELAARKQTTVRISDKQAKALANFYLDKKEKIEKNLLKLKQEIQAKIEKQEKNFQKQAEAYETLLQARHDYRMKKFGFELTDFGWYNAASKIELKEVKTFELNVSVDNGSNYERTYTYVVNPLIKSIFSLLASDNIHFNQVFSDDPDLLLWENQTFNVIGVGYKNETIGYKISESTQQPVTNAVIHLDDKTIASLKKDLVVFNRGYRNENKILTDLDYQAIFHKEAIRKQNEYNEAMFMDQLRRIIFPCCYAQEGDVVLIPSAPQTFKK